MQAAAMSSLVYPSDPQLWVNHLAPIGAAEKWISGDEWKTAPRPSWLSEEEEKMHAKILAQKGYVGPTNWYTTPHHFKK
jgi:soluble epoxide hydrolase/lipid-phosphate phosphatase